MKTTECGSVEIGGRKPDFSGKVRDIYNRGDQLLIITTDRISAFDVILPCTIPAKGSVLNATTTFWFEKLSNIVPNHVITTDPAEYGEPFSSAAELLQGRSMLVRRAEVFPFECVVRGYLAGSGWKDYCRTGTISGIPLPDGMVESERFPTPLFTPSTKAEEGHDEPVSFERLVEDLGRERAEELRSLSLELYRSAAEHAASRGIIIADTKFEFGLIDGAVHIVDEALTPDSSRFWKADSYQPGKPQEAFDKQYVREYLLGIEWRGDSDPPMLPGEVISGTSKRYREILEILTS